MGLELWESAGGRVTAVARRNDPETSHEAAEEFTAKQAKAQRSVRVVVALLTAEGPCTDFEILHLWPRYWGESKWSESLPRKARHWARLAGLVRHEGHGEHQGRRVRRWALGGESCRPKPKAPVVDRLTWGELDMVITFLNEHWEEFVKHVENHGHVKARLVADELRQALCDQAEEVS